MTPLNLPRFRFLLVTIASLFFTTAAFTQQERVVYSFRGAADGSAPGAYASLVSDAGGNLYGTSTQGGGSKNCGSSNHIPIGCGTVFQLVPPQQAGGPWAEHVLYAFQLGLDGGAPGSPLAIDAAGNLYGTTGIGGTLDYGTVFELSPPAVQGGAWTYTLLYSYTDYADGFNPNGVILDSAGNLYSEEYGYPNTFGNIFELSPPAVQGGAWTYTLLYTFNGIGDGGWPRGNFSLDAQGNLYGATNFGGQSCQWNECGTVFELIKPSAPGDPWTDQTLYTFTGGNDGGQPYSGVVFHNGNLYGATTSGGSGSGGTLFALSPPQSQDGNWTFHTIFSFDLAVNGGSPTSGLIIDGKGNLYGVSEASAQGFTSQVYKVSPPSLTGGNWTFQSLYIFSSCTTGCNAFGNVIFGSSPRNLFGMTESGGKNSQGVVYEVVQ